LLTRFCSWGWRFGITEEEVTLVPGPIFHQSFGSVALISLCVGARVVLRTEFRGAQILDDLENRGVTWSFLVPKMLSTLLESAAGARVGACKQLRGIMSSGARLPTPVIAGFEALFPNKSLSDAYGWTESGWITYCRHEDMMRTDRSLGQASFGCELAILDEEGRRLGSGEIGQIHAANPVPFLGYYNNPDATAAMATLGAGGSTGGNNESRLKVLIAGDDGGRPALHAALAGVYAADSRWAEATQEYFTALAKDPGNPDLAFNVAASLDQNRNPGMALAYYGQALLFARQRPTQIDPQAIERRMSQLQARMGRSPAAETP
jgi:acyl-CoA synthetase (AMP-forming)/AMP-acid ligase II